MSLGRLLLIIQHVALGLAVAVVFGLLFGWVVMVAWNAVVPDLLAMPALTYWQAFAMLVLTRVLVGSFNHGSHGHKTRPCAPSRSSSASDATLYAAWWEKEGKPAFEAHAARHLAGDGGAGDAE